MPQELRVVCCYKCESFQVDIQKKSNKWKCKLCGERQSLKKVYSSGAGKDCRKIVQELNKLRFKRDTALEERLKQLAGTVNENVTQQIQSIEEPSTSKWDEFIENEAIDSHDEEREIQTSPPRKKVKLSLDQINDKPEPIKFHFVECVSTKKTQKRQLLHESDDFNTPSKYSRLNDSSRSSAMEADSVNLSVNKWIHYINDNECIDEDDKIKNEQIKSSARKTKKARSTDKATAHVAYSESQNCISLSQPQSNENYNWSFHTEWDSFSEPSQTSFNEGDLNDIIDDQFEEFEVKTLESLPASKQKAKPFELFSTVGDNKDLDSILEL